MDKWLKNAYLRLDRMPEAAKEVREQAEQDLYFFAKLMNPHYMYGEIHKEVFRWLMEYSLYGKGDQADNKLLMLPRAHLKSHIAAVFATWIIIRHPDVSILYVSATADLAEQQLMVIKNFLESPTFSKYWPEYVNPDSGKREKWSNSRIIIDHPLRKEEGIRDATVSTAGLTTNTTGWHADVIICDDVVVPDNAYTEEGRESVSKKTSQFTSIRNVGGFTFSCGTRYDPRDIYGVWEESYYEVYNDLGEVVDKKPVWTIKKYSVEEDGMFLWPRVVREDGKMFGFDMNALSRIKSEYTDVVQFYAQYYNNPNEASTDRISRDKFQYYNQRFLNKKGDRWYYKNNRLNVYAAVDFAFSLKTKADYTAIVVIGIDSDNNIYVLDIDRFKSDKTIDYYNHIKELHAKWNFNKLQAEVTVAQKVIVNDIKSHVRSAGLRLSVEEYRPTRKEGSKQERIAAALEPRYDNLKVWHFEGGWTPTLEDELVQRNPKHDDIKDAMASAVTIATPPAKSSGKSVKDIFFNNAPKNRFGGVAYR